MSKNDRREIWTQIIEGKRAWIFIIHKPDWFCDIVLSQGPAYKVGKMLNYAVDVGTRLKFTELPCVGIIHRVCTSGTS